METKIKCPQCGGEAVEITSERTDSKLVICNECRHHQWHKIIKDRLGEYHLTGDATIERALFTDYETVVVTDGIAAGVAQLGQGDRFDLLTGAKIALLRQAVAPVPFTGLLPKYCGLLARNGQMTVVSNQHDLDKVMVKASARRAIRYVVQGASGWGIPLGDTAEELPVTVQAIR